MRSPWHLACEITSLILRNDYKVLKVLLDYVSFTPKRSPKSYSQRVLVNSCAALL